MRQINGALVEMVRAQGPAGLADAMAAGLFGPVKFDGTARAEAQFLHDCTSTDARSLEYGLQAIMAFDALGRLGQVGVPALVLTGEHEGNLPDQEVLVAALPDATLVSMAGTGHMAPAEDPAGFGVALGPFLDRLGSRAAPRTGSRCHRRVAFARQNSESRIRGRWMRRYSVRLVDRGPSTWDTPCTW